MDSTLMRSRRSERMRLGLLAFAFICFVVALFIDAVEGDFDLSFYLVLAASVLMAIAIAASAVRFNRKG